MAHNFNDLFDRWSKNYDESVSGADIEYRDVFKNYEDILQLIAFRSHGWILEFGVGTGNLTKKLIEHGHSVKGIEPSFKMRVIAKQKLPHTTIVDGHFLKWPNGDEQVNTIVSSYAFHHLTDTEKEKAIAKFAKMLNKGGKIVFADTVFFDEDAHERAILVAKSRGYFRLVNDLKTEYYTTLPILDKMFKKYGFMTHYEKMNDFVWLIEAKKGDVIINEKSK